MDKTRELINVVPKDEVMHTRFAYSKKDLVEREREIATLGAPDMETTGIFRAYRLPGQNKVLNRNGESVNFYTAMLDPEEYVVPVNSGNIADFVRMCDREGKFEVILGNPEYPETCYRFKIVEAKIDDELNNTRLIVLQNVQYLKSTVPRAGLMKLSDGSESAYMENVNTYDDDGPIAHQRMPPNAKASVEQTAFDLDTDNAKFLVVAIDAEALIKCRGFEG